MIDLDATLGEQFLDIAVGQSVAQLPANGRRDHFWWEAEPGEAHGSRGAGTRRSPAAWTSPH